MLLFKSAVVLDLAFYHDIDLLLSANHLGYLLFSKFSYLVYLVFMLLIIYAAAGGDWTDLLFSTASAASGHFLFVDDPH